MPAIGKQEALEMLASAINYCQQSGLLVRAGNVDGKLALTIEGAHIDRSGLLARFVAGTMPADVPATGVPAFAESVAGTSENLSQQGHSS